MNAATHVNGYMINYVHDKYDYYALYAALNAPCKRAGMKDT